MKEILLTIHPNGLLEVSWTRGISKEDVRLALETALEGLEDTGLSEETREYLQ